MKRVARHLLASMNESICRGSLGSMYASQSVLSSTLASDDSAAQTAGCCTAADKEDEGVLGRAAGNTAADAAADDGLWSCAAVVEATGGTAGATRAAKGFCDGGVNGGKVRDEEAVKRLAGARESGSEMCVMGWGGACLAHAAGAATSACAEGDVT